MPEFTVPGSLLRRAEAMTFCLHVLGHFRRLLMIGVVKVAGRIRMMCIGSGGVVTVWVSLLQGESCLEEDTSAAHVCQIPISTSTRIRTLAAVLCTGCTTRQHGADVTTKPGSTYGECRLAISILCECSSSMLESQRHSIPEYSLSRTR